MNSLKAKDIIKVTNGELVNGNQELICENFSKDTRTIQKKDIYIGIKGENFDGSMFWEKAFENGADCVIVENISFTKENLEKYKDKTIIKVDNTLQALYDIAKLKRSLYNIPIIAVTGSVGKTSTKDIISSVVSQKYKTLKTIGNNNNNIGLPLTILRLKDEEAMVIEMGTNHFGEIKVLSEIAKPNICVITNIGTSHIGNFGSRENILKAKLEILEGSKDPVVVINNDNDLLHDWYKKNKDEINIYKYGLHSESDIQVSNICLLEDESQFESNIDNKNIKITIPVGGEHFVLNALCAITVGRILDINIDKISKGIKEFELTKKRMETTKLSSGIKIINDAYNASFESMNASFEYLSQFKENRKIAVLGDMLELGEYSEKLHKDLGKSIVKNNIDILICNGDNSKNIILEAQKQGMSTDKTYYFENKNDIVDKLKEIAKQGDIILFKASNGMRFFDLAEKLKELL